MQIDVFPAYANQKVGAMIMVIAAYRGAPTGVQQLSLSFFSEEVVDKFIREIGAYVSLSQIEKSTNKITVRVYPDYANLLPRVRHRIRGLMEHCCLSLLSSSRIGNLETGTDFAIAFILQTTITSCSKRQCLKMLQHN